MKNVWIMAAALVLVLGAAGYTIAQSTGGPQGGMMGPGMGMMSGGQGGMMGSGMMGQQLSPEQLEQFAKQHGITVEQARQMTDACHQMMGTTTTPEAPKQ
jgi:hypothetical protein